MFFSLLLLILSLASGLGLFLILKFLSPSLENGNLIIINLIYFFLSIWVFLAASVSLLLYSLSSFSMASKSKREAAKVHRPRLIFRNSFKQGSLVATTLVVLGILKVSGFSNPLNVILVLSAAILVEFYFFGH